MAIIAWGSVNAAGIASWLQCPWRRNEWQTGIDQSEVSVCGTHKQLTAITHRDGEMRHADTTRTPNVWLQTADSLKLSCQILNQTGQTARYTGRQKDRQRESVCSVKLEAIIGNSTSCFVEEHPVLSYYIHHVPFMELWKVSHNCGGTVWNLYIHKNG